MNKPKWKCPVCKLPKTGSVSPLVKLTADNTPTQAPLTSFVNVDSGKLFAYMDSKFKSLEESMRKQIRDLETSVKLMSDQYDAVIKNLDTQSKEIKILRTDNKSLKESIQLLQEKVESLEEEGSKRDQWSRLQNIELVGIPEQDNESLPDVMVKLAKYVGAPLQQSDVEFAHRVQAKRPTKGKPRAIIARLRERATKDALVHGSRKCRGMTTKDLGLEGEPLKVHVNEHLTVANKNLLSKCRKRATEKEYTFVWTKNCRIYVRKAENKPYIQISKEADLKKIV